VLAVAVLAGLKTAVTPAGRLDVTRLTLPPKLSGLITEIAELALGPPATICGLTGEAERVKLGVGMVMAMVVVLVRVPDVPVTVAVYAPGRA
jgi:hypothetical protein